MRIIIISCFWIILCNGVIKMTKESIDDILKWGYDNNIEQKTIDCFYDFLKIYQKEEPHEFNSIFVNFNKDKLNMYISNVSLSLENWPECNYTPLAVTLQFEYCKKHMGYYTVLYDFNAEIVDEYLSLF